MSKDAVISRLSGGLGNQMFQYAFGRVHSLKRQSALYMDPFEYNYHKLRKYELDVFNVKTKLLSLPQQFRYFLQKKYLTSPKIYSEPHFHFDEKALNSNLANYFEGFWQSEKYFRSIRHELIQEFLLKITFPISAKTVLDEILLVESVSLHIRRGDYISNSEANKCHGVLPLKYYYDSIYYIKSLKKNIKLYIFSDDIPWAKKNLKVQDDILFIESIPQSAHIEMHLMKNCKHNIIANSSFSWWGAWLNENPEKIVCAPQSWFDDKKINTADILPESWIKIKND